MGFRNWLFAKQSKKEQKIIEFIQEKINKLEYDYEKTIRISDKEPSAKKVYFDLMNSSNFYNNECIDIIFTIMRYIKDKKYYNPEFYELIKKLALNSPYNTNFLINYINTNFLNHDKVELLAKGYVTKTFRFYSDEDKKEYLSFIDDFIQQFTKVYPNTFAGFGTALAARRNGKLIPHDNDLDFVTIVRANAEFDYDKTKLEILKFVESLGYIVNQQGWPHIQILKGESGLLDMFIGVEYPDGFINIEGFEPIRSEIILPLNKTLKLENLTITVPHEVETYLEHLYGPNWLIPDKNFIHSYDDDKVIN